MTPRRLLLWVALVGCTLRAPRPEPIDTSGNEACAYCRMIISDTHTAAQLAAPGEVPRSFDDIGCLANYLKANPRLPKRAAAYVADHRTGELVLAAHALYVRQPAVTTPMGSHLLAYADAASRAADPAAAGAVPMQPADVFGAPPPDGR